MLKRHGETLRLGLMAWEAVLAAGVWEGTYWLRFYSGAFAVSEGIPPHSFYRLAAPMVALTFHLIFRRFGLYSPWRTRGMVDETIVLGKAFALAGLVLGGLSYAYHELLLSRLFLLVFLAVFLTGVLATRIGVRTALRMLRTRGYNLRHCLIVGDGAQARDLAERLRQQAWLGLHVAGILGSPAPLTVAAGTGPRTDGAADLASMLRDQDIDQIFLVLAPTDPGFASVIETANTEGIPVTVAPDPKVFGPLLHARAESLAGIPVYTLIDSPIFGAGAIVKRAFDVVFSLFVLLLLSPLLLLLAVGVKLSSPGPVFYRQERVGLDGERFAMLKFRTMPVDAEQTTGPVWNRKGAARATPFGALLRHTSLDELPQFLNVLRGDMSVVGPRPERPYFIEQFKHEIRLYNVRHRVKAGITGWAQVNGWRGDTSLEKRIEFDLDYLRNWSLWLDLKIVLLTVFRGFWHENAG